MSNMIKTNGAVDYWGNLIKVTLAMLFLVVISLVLAVAILPEWLVTVVYVVVLALATITELFAIAGYKSA